MKKKSITKYQRKVWIINPKTRTKENDKIYDRNRARKQFKKEIDTNYDL